ncbi:unnamed protein product [Lampetra planeri]
MLLKTGGDVIHQLSHRHQAHTKASGDSRHWPITGRFERGSTLEVTPGTLVGASSLAHHGALRERAHPGGHAGHRACWARARRSALNAAAAADDAAPRCSRQQASEVIYEAASG